MVQRVCVGFSNVVEKLITQMSEPRLGAVSVRPAAHPITPSASHSPNWSRRGVLLCVSTVGRPHEPASAHILKDTCLHHVLSIVLTVAGLSLCLNKMIQCSRGDLQECHSYRC